MLWLSGAKWSGRHYDRALTNMKPQPDTSTQEVLAGLVERVTYHNAENGFCVLRAKVRGHREVVTVVGHAAAIAAGEWVTATGDWVNDRTHGQQFKARFLRTSPPTSAHRPSGAARGQRTRSSVYTRSSSDGSKRRPCCHRPILLRCCSGRCSPQDRSTCAKLTVGSRLPQTPSINRLTSLPDSVLSNAGDHVTPNSNTSGDGTEDDHEAKEYVEHRIDGAQP